MALLSFGDDVDLQGDLGDGMAFDGGCYGGDIAHIDGGDALQLHFY